MLLLLVLCGRVLKVVRLRLLLYRRAAACGDDLQHSLTHDSLLTSMEV